MTFPKIELHVHLEGTVRARTLLQIAGRNGVPLPADTVEGLAALYEFRDFAHFLDVWPVIPRGPGHHGLAGRLPRAGQRA